MRKPLLATSLLLIAALTASPMASVQASQTAARGSGVSQEDKATTLATSIARHPEKIPAEFQDRLKYALPDGTIQVMVALNKRDVRIERFVKANTTWLKWYGNSPRFLGRVTRTQMAALIEHDAVAFVEPDYPIENFMSTSSLDVNARSLASKGTGIWSYDAASNSLTTEIPQITADMATGKGVTVSIVDSGIDKTHRDFGGFNCDPGPYSPCDSRIVRTVNVEHIADIPDEGMSLPTTEAASGHGTHVAGTVAGNAFYTRDTKADPARYGADGHNFGVAPQASLISIKNGDTLWAGLSNFALQWTLEHAGQYGIKVSSNSWGCVGGCSFNGSSATAQLLRDLYGAGVVVVFAAGNDAGGPDGVSLSGNSQSPYVLGVAAYDDANAQLASFSSRGKKSDSTLYDPATWTPGNEPANGTRRPDIAAPGVGIWSAASLTGGAASLIPRVWLGDVDQSGPGTVPYRTMSGTSMATPHVAGAIALLFSSCPGAQQLDVMRAVMAGANNQKIRTTGGGPLAEPYEVGYGGLDVRASLDWLASTQVCTWAKVPTP